MDLNGLDSLLKSAEISIEKTAPTFINGRRILPIHLFSYSSQTTLHTCPRKLELYKMGKEGAWESESSIDLSFGSAVGDGVQCLLRGESLDKAWLTAFLSWSGGFFDIDEKAKKSLAHALAAIKTFSAYVNVLMQEWEVFTFVNKEGKERQATELSAIVHFPNGYMYRIYIDCVLRNKTTGKLLVLELKTTKFKKIDEALYGNSAQALSYSVILDAIAPGNTEYDVWYYSYSTTEEDWEFFPFTKDRLAKANWFRTILHDTNNIQQMLESGFYPKHGENCYAFFRRCQYYGSCDMSRDALYASEEEMNRKVLKELEESFDFSFTLEELIDNQLANLTPH